MLVMSGRKYLGDFDLAKKTHLAQKETWNPMEYRRPPRAFSNLFGMVQYGKREADTVYIGETIKDLYYTVLQVGEDDKWFGIKPLGAGAYGVVALFGKEDQTGAVVDASGVRVPVTRGHANGL